jgi:two-component system, chemotaxis family, protein-glutamate methylesterase/glutaminase
MAKIRVLVVDDSVVVRRLVSDALNADPGVEVVGTAANGRIALAKIPQCNPDVIILDVEMPIMDGLETIAAIREQWRRLPVVMFSTLTERGASVTLDALALGANDYVPKPTNVGNVANAILRVQQDLLPRVHALGAGSASRSMATAAPGRAAAPGTATAGARVATAAPRAVGRIDVVVIAVSTGGPNALGEVVPRLPATLAVPVLVVQHMPPLFTKMLADRLDARSALQVVEAADGDVPTPGGVWLAPGGKHLVLARSGAGTVLRTNEDPMENSCRPAADPLLRSVVAAHGANVLAVVLTGMGQDGLRGAKAVRDAGGQVIVQDEASSVVWGMPGFVARAGIADAICPLDAVAREITGRVRKGRSAALAGTARR